MTTFFFNIDVILHFAYSWDVTTPKQDAEHKAINKNIVRTRFPPEPNGYLHIGHAKSMNMNFSLAFEKLGVPVENRETIFRFDDTNPEAESVEYIDNIREDVSWMGWTPVKTT
jgi:glutaminyl-tRNA synthetase